MPTYRVTFTTTEARITTLEKKLREQYLGETFTVHRIDENKSRAERLQDAEGDVNAAASTVQELIDEAQGWVDNLPENVQGGEKEEQLNDLIGDLQEIVDTLEGIGWDIEFPGMTG